MRIEISFDDGHVSDLRAARMLSERGLTGTFYFPSNQCPRTTRLTLEELVKIHAMGHEIGGHTVNHPMDMKLLTDDELKFEIGDNKLMIETLVTKKPITKFCYPRGRHDTRVRQAVKDAGYLEARTTRVLELVNMTEDPFNTGTTVHMFERSEYDGVPWWAVAEEWLKTAAEMDEVPSTVPMVFSLWGHSWELDRDCGWERFAETLDLIKSKLSPIGANAPSGL